MRAHLLTAALAATSLTAQAQWTEVALPNTLGGGLHFDHLSDGRAVINDTDRLIVQDALGSANFSPHAAQAGHGFHSFLEIAPDNTAVIGPGNLSPGILSTFEADNLSNTNVSTVGASVQDYDGAMRDTAGLYISGGNGSGTFTDFFGGTAHSNSVSHIRLNDGVGTLLIDNISQYSAALATDQAGNLYVGNNDDGVVRKFTPTQLTDGINGGAAMEFGDGSFVFDFGSGGNIGSLAVDGLGRVWAAGWAQIGMQVYDPALDLSKTFAPGMANANYLVATFSQDSTDYVSYVNASGLFSAGSTANYGYINAAQVMVPEPSSLLLMLLGSLGMMTWRKINQRVHTH